MNAFEMLSRKAKLARWLQDSEVPALAGGDEDVSKFLIDTSAVVRKKADAAGELREEAIEYAEALQLLALVIMNQNRMLLADLIGEAQEVEADAHVK
jgi:hypothetical protein